MTDTAASPVLTFHDVTIYTRTEFFGNIQRTDVKELTIQIGVKYAQYDNAIKVRFKEPRQRTLRGFTLDYKPFLVVVKRTDAFNPPDFLLPADENGVQHSRYSSCDSRWQSDFFALLYGRAITPLFAIGEEDPQWVTAP